MQSGLDQRANQAETPKLQYCIGWLKLLIVGAVVTATATTTSTSTSASTISIIMVIIILFDTRNFPLRCCYSDFVLSIRKTEVAPWGPSGTVSSRRSTHLASSLVQDRSSRWVSVWQGERWCWGVRHRGLWLTAMPEIVSTKKLKAGTLLIEIGWWGMMRLETVTARKYRTHAGFVRTTEAGNIDKYNQRQSKGTGRGIGCHYIGLTCIVSYCKL